MINKCTLLIDGNWLLISRFSVMKNLFDSNLPEETLRISTNKLKDMMARSINVMLNKLPMVDNIIFISDGGSWRKQLDIPKQLGDITYKGNRDDEKPSDISWNHVFKALNELSKSCASQGITTSHQFNIEGDDWVWYWSRRLNEQGINCIIWSSDNDLKQLIQRKNGAFTAWYYERSGKSVIAFPDCMEIKNPEEGDMDFFMNPIQYKERLVEELERKVGKTSYVDPNTIITSKIICGDSGDNIKSVVRLKKNGRTYGVSQKDWEKISGKLEVVTIQDLIEKSTDISKEISVLKKFDNKISQKDILEMIEYNIKLVWLNEQVIPDTIIDVMNQQEYLQVDTDYFRGSYTSLLGEDDEIKDIFEGI